MPYKISGTKSETARVIIIKESDWSIESNTVVSGSGDYEIDSLESGSKLAFSRAEDGEVVGFGDVTAESYATPPGDRGLFAGGYTGAYNNIIDYITISTTGNAIDFGDLITGRYGFEAVASTTRGVFGGGVSDGYKSMEYVTISTPGDASSFGTLINNHYYGASAGNNTRGLFAGENNTIEYITISTLGDGVSFGDLIEQMVYAAAAASPTRVVFALSDHYNAAGPMEYVTIATTGNATNFGNMERRYAAGASSSVRGLFASAFKTSSYSIEYITIATPSNSTDFGDLTVHRNYMGGTSNSTRAVFGGGVDYNTIDYVTIATTGNAANFGDLTFARSEGQAGCSNGHGGLQS